PEPILNGPPAAVFPDNHGMLAPTDRFGAHDLIGCPVFQQAVLVDSRFVGEGVAADNRFVWLNGDPGNFGQQPAGGNDLGGIDADCIWQGVAAGAERHDDFFQGGIAGPFTNAVDRALDLPRTRLNGGDTVGYGHTQV